MKKCYVVCEVTGDGFQHLYKAFKDYEDAESFIQDEKDRFQAKYGRPMYEKLDIEDIEYVD